MVQYARADSCRQLFAGHMVASDTKEGKNVSNDDGVIKWLAVLAGTTGITGYFYPASCQLDQQYASCHYLSPAVFAKIFSKEYIIFLNFFQMYFIGVV